MSTPVPSRPAGDDDPADPAHPAGTSTGTEAGTEAGTEVVAAGAHVRVEITAGVATVRLDRPPLNAIDSGVRGGLVEAVDVVAARPDVAAVVVYGGERTFAAGADIKELAGLGVADVLRYGQALQDALTRLARLPKPSVAAVTGYALGGGFELALACDFRVLADDAVVGLPEVQLGLIPGAGGTQRLARLTGPARAKDLVLSGRRVGAAEARSLGLAEEVVPPGEVLAAATARASGFVGGPAVALAAAKDAIDRGLEAGIDAGLALERALFAGLFGTADGDAGLRSFVEEGPGRARFTGR